MSRCDLQAAPPPCFACGDSSQRGGRPAKPHSWKSDLYLKKKKKSNNPPQMFCKNKNQTLGDNLSQHVCDVHADLCKKSGWGDAGQPHRGSSCPPAPVPAGGHRPAGNVTPELGPSPAAGTSLGYGMRLWSSPHLPPAPGAGGRTLPKATEKPVPGWGWHRMSLARSTTVPRAAGEELGAAEVKSLPWEAKQTQKRQSTGNMGCGVSPQGATPAPPPSPARCTPCSSSPSSR